jgi:uncharacterized protein (TIGR02611 family)
VLLRHTIRAGRVAVGLALVAIGIILAIPGVPGPGLLVIFGGLTLLAAEFSWAERLRDRMRETVQRLTRRGNG